MNITVSNSASTATTTTDSILISGGGGSGGIHPGSLGTWGGSGVFGVNPNWHITTSNNSGWVVSGMYVSEPKIPKLAEVNFNKLILMLVGYYRISKEHQTISSLHGRIITHLCQFNSYNTLQSKEANKIGYDVIDFLKEHSIITVVENTPTTQNLYQTFGIPMEVLFVFNYQIIAEIIGIDAELISEGF